VLLCACAARAEAPLPADYFGMNLNRVLFDDPTPGHPAPLAAARAAGVTHGRIDFPWDAVQPRGPLGHSYDWTDKAVTALANQGIVATPMLGYSAPWAATQPGNPKAPPRNLGDYVAFAQLMVRRYGPGGSFWTSHPKVPYLPVHRWEIWNEPNLPQVFWQTGSDPDEYARMYIGARAAIKAVDPTAMVIVAGMNSDDPGFVTQMYASHPELRGQVDGLGIHPYASTVQGVLDSVRTFRAELDAQGETSVPMEVTEVGWQRHGSTNLTIDGSQRAAYMAEVANILARSDCNIDAFEPYTWETAEQDPANGEDWFGMWSPTQGLLPTGQAYANTVAQYATPEVRASARASMLIRVCHPLPAPLSVRVQTRGHSLRLQVRAGTKGVRSAVVVVQMVGRNRRRTVRLITGSGGYARYRLTRTIKRVSVVAAASGFGFSHPVRRRLR
jgi:Glycosyl hydrolase catalytic core